MGDPERRPIQRLSAREEHRAAHSARARENSRSLALSIRFPRVTRAPRTVPYGWAGAAVPVRPLAVATAQAVMVKATGRWASGRTYWGAGNVRSEPVPDPVRLPCPLRPRRRRPERRQRSPETAACLDRCACPTRPRAMRTSYCRNVSGPTPYMCFMRFKPHRTGRPNLEFMCAPCPIYASFIRSVASRTWSTTPFHHIKSHHMSSGLPAGCAWRGGRRCRLDCFKRVGTFEWRRLGMSRKYLENI